MKNFLTTILLLSILAAFSLFIVKNAQYKTILIVESPTRIGIDFDNNKTIDNNEYICIEDIESFSLNPTDEFFNKYSKSLDLTKSDMISLGYLAQEYAQKTLTNQKVKVKLGKTATKECKYGSIQNNGINYKDTLANSGFGIINDKPFATDKYKKHLEAARKLNLVILNHHSGKFHTLDCPYGKIAHDTVVIPEKQLPTDVKPCKFCHNSQNKKKFEYKKDIDIFEIPQIIQPPLKVTDGDIQVYYTDFTKNLKPSNNCTAQACKEFIKLTDNAKSSIDIAIYGYHNIPPITEALKRAKARGVNIRFVYDENYDATKTYYKDNHIISKLSTVYKSDKSESKTLSDMTMHNKFIIFDNKTVYTGSMNLSSTGTSGYDVNEIIVINSKDIVQLYTKEFEQMLNGKFHTQKAPTSLNNKFKLGNSEVEVYFSPQDKPTTKRIIQLIRNSKSYIYIPTFLMTHNELAKELIAAKNRGVDVRVIIDANSTFTRNTKHSLLRKNGILLKTENYAGKLHSKTMIIDDEYLITGSMNFSISGENKNDENTLIIKNSKIAKANKEFFLYLWTMIPNKYLKYNAKPESPDSIGSCTDGIDNNFNGKIDSEEETCKTK